MIETAFKILIALLCPPIAFGFGKAILDTAAHSDDLGGIVWFVSGLISFVPIWIIFRGRLELFATFEHEMTHVLFGLVFLKIPRSINVSHIGGSVTMIGGNFLITLAPYFFPTLSFALLLLLPAVDVEWFQIYSFILGASVSFHLASTKGEIHLNQIDLRKAGLWFCSIFLPVANMVCYGAVSVVVLSPGESFLGYWWSGASETIHAIRFLASFLLDLGMIGGHSQN